MEYVQNKSEFWRNSYMDRNNIDFWNALGYTKNMVIAILEIL